MPHVRLLAALCFSAIVACAWQSDLAEEARRAREAMLARRYTDAVEIYRKMVAAAPDEPDLQFDLALALHSAGRYREAVNELNPIRTPERDNSKYWFLLGLGYLKLGEPGKAVGPLGNAARLDPANVDARLELASAYLESGQLESADREYRRLSVDHPALPDVWAGLSLSDLRLSGKALKGLDKAAESEIGNMAADNCDARSPACAFAKGDWLQVTELAAKLRSPEGFYWASRAYAQLARESTQKLADLPPSPEQHQMLARVHGERGQRSEAILELRQAAGLNDRDPAARGQLARALWTDRKYDEAIEILTPLVAATPDQPEWQFELGDALFSLGKPEEALGHLQKAVKSAPDMLSAQAKLGELLLQLGDAAGAVSHLERAESLDHDGSIHYQLALAYRRLGDSEKASHALARRNELQHNAKSSSQ